MARRSAIDSAVALVTATAGLNSEEEEATALHKDRNVTISPPNFETAAIQIVGLSPYVQNQFSGKAYMEMKAKQQLGAKAQKGRKREAKDFKLCYEEAKHKFADGTCGIPAPAFRNAMISACRLVGFRMTQGKLSIFIEADGIDARDGTPLVRFTRGEPEYSEKAVRNDSGVADIRARPLWQPGWRATVRVRFDADIFSVADVMNLLARAGQQVGIGEGRPDSKNSCGLGWGLFEPMSEEELKKEVR